MATARQKPLLRLKIDGPGVRHGAISVPELVKICEHAQAAVNRQAEAMEGGRSLRPGPVISAVKKECTLELIGIAKGSVMLRFGLAKLQFRLPSAADFGEEVVASVASILQSLSRRSAAAQTAVDPGVLDSLNSLGEVFDKESIAKIEWLVPRCNGRQPIRAVYTKVMRERVAERMRLPAQKRETVEGTLEMADFKETDQKCRIHPALGYPIICAFDKGLEDRIYALLRKAVRLTGQAKINPNTGRIDSIQIEEIEPIEPLSLDAQAFFSGKTIEELAAMQGVKPLETIRVLAGGWPEQDNLDEMLEEIYRDREL